MEQLPVHIDAAGCKVDVHRLPLCGDDPLHDGLPIPEIISLDDDDVPGLKSAAQGRIQHQQAVLVLQRLPHGGAGHQHHAHRKGEQQHHCQYHPHQSLYPLVQPLKGHVAPAEPFSAPQATAPIP